MDVIICSTSRVSSARMYTVAWIQLSVCVSVYVMYYVTTAASPAERAPAAAVAPGLLEPSPPGI